MEFIKKTIPHSELSINAYLKKNVKQSILFIHGGPGFNSMPLQYLIEEHGNLPESIIMPPKVVPWPPTYLVRE